MIDEARMRRIATRALQRSGWGSHVEALHPPGDPAALPLSVHGMDTGSCWIGGAASPYIAHRLGPTVIVALDAATAKVVYTGPAHDEG